MHIQNRMNWHVSTCCALLKSLDIFGGLTKHQFHSKVIDNLVIIPPVINVLTGIEKALTGGMAKQHKKLIS